MVTVTAFDSIKTCHLLIRCKVDANARLVVPPFSHQTAENPEIAQEPTLCSWTQMLLAVGCIYRSGYLVTLLYVRHGPKDGCSKSVVAIAAKISPHIAPCVKPRLARGEDGIRCKAVTAWT